MKTVMADKLCDLVDKLPSLTNKLDSLQNVKILLDNIPPRNLKELVPNISFNVIFECLNTENVDQITECCGVLEKLLNAVEAPVLLPQFHADLFLGLGHPNQAVQLLCLLQSQRIAESCPQILAEHSDVLNQIVSSLGDESLEVAKEAAKVIMLMGQKSSTLETLFLGDGLAGFHSLLEKNDVIRCRVYELVIDLCKLSADLLTICSGSGLVQKLINELYKDDILMQLNILELLTRLARVNHGLEYLQEQGVISKLDEMLQAVDSDPLMGFLLPGLVKFFGSVAYLNPSNVCDRHPGFLPMVFSHLENNDPSTRALAAETIGLLGSTSPGKHILIQRGSSMLEACKHIGALYKDPSNELKIKGLGAMEKLLHLSVADLSSESLSATQLWYQRFAPDLLTLLLDATEQPFQDVRCAVYSVMESIANMAWGQTLFRDHPTFTVFLLNRNTESTKEGKEGKYAIVRTLVNSQTTMEIVGRVYYMKLKEYYNEGPFYVQAESAVSMESG